MTERYWIALHTYDQDGRSDGPELDKGSMHYGGGYIRSALVLGQPNTAHWAGGAEYWHTITGFTVWLDKTASDCQIKPFSSLDLPIGLWKPDRPLKLLAPSTWQQQADEPPHRFGHRIPLNLEIRNFIRPAKGA